MIKIIDISKTYQPKKGQPIHALNHVSIDFPSKGLVFVLGKSGSGKSTLLNIVGGLDTPDQGEIIINGKSSKDFSANDYDYYRGTYVGFIFQEYNLLEDFNVGKNVGLSIEIQGKTATLEIIDKALTDVDLKGYEQRDINELSGGQKQRVAIARALIKNPSIIIADEPSGALDSETGKEVFDTLKRLSKDKLVMIISHDKEVALNYADRIIEIKDGHIISDKVRDTKSKVQDKNTEDIVEMAKKKDFSEAQISALLEQFKTDDSANQFIDRKSTTDDKDIQTYHLIKTSLKTKDAIKIGASSLRLKKIRLFFTILLSVVSIGMFGTIDTMAAYDIIPSHAKTLADNHQYNARIMQYKYTIQEQIESPNNTGNIYESFSNENLLAIQQSFPDDVVIPLVYNFIEYYETEFGATEISLQKLKTIMRRFDKANAFVNQHFYEKMTYDFLFGTMPSDNEVVISEFIFHTYKTFGFVYFEPVTNEAVIILPSEFHETDDAYNFSLITNKRISETYDFYISGVVDTGFDYDNYLSTTYLNNLNSSNDQSFVDYVNNNFHTLFFLNEDALQHYQSNRDFANEVYTHRLNMYYEHLEQPNVEHSNYVRESGLFQDKLYMFTEHQQLQDDELILSIGSLYRSGLYTAVLTTESDFITVVLNKTTNEKIQFETVQTFYDWLNIPANLATFKEIILSENETFIVRNLLRKTVGTYKLAGIYMTEYNSPSTPSSRPRAILSVNQTITLSTNQEEYLDFGPFNYVLFKAIGDDSQLNQKFLKLFNLDYGYHLTFTTSYSNVFASINEQLKSLTQMFLFFGLIFAGFAVLLIMNFIATSVSIKRRQIGILRALGARSVDVAKIFLSESLIIAFINVFLSLVLVLFSVEFLNQEISKLMGMNISILVLSIRQILLIFAISVLSATIASLIPVLRISLMKPIDAIKSK